MAALPLEKRATKDDSGREVPLLDPSQVSDVLFLPYVPYSKEASEADLAERKEILCMLLNDITWLLKQTYHKFWSQVIFDETFHTFMDSYLVYAPRAHDDSFLVFELGNDLSKVEQELYRSVFMVILRMSTHKESKDNFMTGSCFGDIIYENWLFDMPKLFDIATLYGRPNPQLVSKMISNIFKQQPKYEEDLDMSIQTVNDMISKARVKCAIDSKPGPPKLDQRSRVASLPNEVEDLLTYTIDIAATLTAYLTVDRHCASALQKHKVLQGIASLYEVLIPHLDALCGIRNEPPKARTCRLWLTFTAQEILEAVCNQEAKSSSDRGHMMINIFEELLPCEKFLSDWASKSNFSKILDLLNKSGMDDINPIRADYILAVVRQAANASDVHPSTTTASNISSATAFSGMRPASLERQNQYMQSSDGATGAVTDVELESKIDFVTDVLPDLGRGFVAACLAALQENTERVINSILEASLPPEVESLDRKLSMGDWTNLLPVAQPKAVAASDAAATDANIPQGNDAHPPTYGPRSVFDGDEFDVFSTGKVDLSRVHRGKKSVATANELLDDKSEVRANTQFYKEAEFEYEDEYDDTYDDTGGPPVMAGEEPDEFLSPLNKIHSYQLDDDDKKQTTSNPPSQKSQVKQEQREGRSVTGRGFGPVGARGGGGGGGRGRGRGRAGQERPKVDLTKRTTESLRARRHKDANKASRANHNRKRGADKKMSQGMF